MRAKARPLLAAAAVSLALLASACTNSDARIGIVPTVTPRPDMVVSFSRDVVPIFTQTQVLSQTCTTSGCHGGAFASLGLSLEPSSAYGGLVNFPSQQVPGLLRVKPGDSDGSYLIHKLEGNQAPGTAQMPFGGPPLGDLQIKLIRDWIDQGAENN
jgi:hypothetical protein